MAYKGYRIKINGVVFPNGNMAPNSYNCSRNKKIIRTFEDADFNKHIDYSDKYEVNIEFALVERDLVKHEQIMQIFGDITSLTIEYWDDITCQYYTQHCYLEPIVFKQKYSNGNDIQYEKQTVKIRGY